MFRLKFQYPLINILQTDPTHIFHSVNGISQMVEYQNGSSLDGVFLGRRLAPFSWSGLIPTEKQRLLVGAEKNLDLFAGPFARHLH